ncbi:TIGR02391 family protein [Streptomyces microflavus]|uniref:TIGR02391 family protein n=1 Tax=Streptomyces microflavus TaxID=1919 RepID=UPI0034192AD0
MGCGCTRPRHTGKRRPGQPHGSPGRSSRFPLSGGRTSFPRRHYRNKSRPVPWTAACATCLFRREIRHWCTPCTQPVVATLSEAARHASSLRSELRRRGTHQEVLRYCTNEILAKNAFHASLEAVKSVSDRLRRLTGEQLDGARFVDAVLMPGGGTARVALNTGSTPTELHEQKGIANLVKGLFSMYRTPGCTAPSPTTNSSNCSPLCPWSTGVLTAPGFCRERCGCRSSPADNLT